MSPSDFFFTISVLSVTANFVQHLMHKAVRQRCDMNEQFIAVLLRYIATGEAPHGMIIHKCEKRDTPCE